MVSLLCYLDPPTCATTSTQDDTLWGNITFHLFSDISLEMKYMSLCCQIPKLIWRIYCAHIQWHAGKAHMDSLEPIDAILVTWNRPWRVGVFAPHKVANPTTEGFFFLDSHLLNIFQRVTAHTHYMTRWGWEMQDAGCRMQYADVTDPLLKNTSMCKLLSLPLSSPLFPSPLTC